MGVDLGARQAGGIADSVLILLDTPARSFMRSCEWNMIDVYIFMLTPGNSGRCWKAITEKIITYDIPCKTDFRTYPNDIPSQITAWHTSGFSTHNREFKKTLCPVVSGSYSPA